MNIRVWLVAVIIGSTLLGLYGSVAAADPPTALEQAMSETLDTWRDGNFEKLFEQLARRGKTSRETFVKKMNTSPIRPACCWQKMENFKILNEKKTEATVYVKIGLDGYLDGSNSSTREFKLTHEGGAWKMQMSDIFSLGGLSGKKGTGKHVKGKHHGTL